jgi:hypothetical protein
VARYDFRRAAYVSARTLFYRECDFRRRVLGTEHPDTSVSGWSLFQTLRKLGEYAAARAVLERDLLWLLDRDPATLSADQRTFREYLANRDNNPS